jgi:hypothetical protein
MMRSLKAIVAGVFWEECSEPDVVTVMSRLFALNDGINLLVLDGVDERRRDLHYPDFEGVHIIVTTCAPDAEYFDVIPEISIGGLEDDEAMKLFRKVSQVSDQER